jgi:asparagine synthase (glutamine-hydrolysing)
MCGICGFNFSDKELINKMKAVQNHRGPDQKGIFIDSSVSLGHVRLSILDLSEAGRQPMANEDNSIIIVFNGEIYNFQELKGLLKNQHSFRSKSDTELLIHLYEEKGIDMLPLLNGMFAFCIYDRKKKMMLCSRDRFGKKPFHYSFDGKTFLFSSELKGIFQYQKPDINQTTLAQYFVYGFIPSPNTIFEGISKLPAGHYLSFDLKSHNLVINQYWDFSEYSIKHESISKSKNELHDTLVNATRKRLISDVPLGLFLSGGIDSSLILGCLSNIVDTKKVDTFSIGFEEKAFDESKFSTMMAEKYHTRHHLKIIKAHDCLDVLPEIIDKMDEPISDPSIVPTYILSEYTRKFVTVALSGDGADELFGGYPKYFIHRYLRFYDHLPRYLQKWFKNIMLYLPTNPNNCLLNYKVKKGVSYLDYPYYLRSNLWTSNFDLDELQTIFKPVISKEDIISPIEHYHSSFHGKDRVNELMYLDIKLMLQDMYLVKVDRASMFHALEVRSPFLDLEVARISGEMPSSFKVKGRITKYILKEIAKKYLPQELIIRQKRGFGIPLHHWVYTDLKKDIIESIESSNCNLFNKTYALSLIEQKNKKADFSSKIWNLYIFLKWYEQWA